MNSNVTLQITIVAGSGMIRGHRNCESVDSLRV
jgi:hypothetical protein